MIAMKYLTFLLVLFWTIPAFAEGGCPPGQYPVGGQGVQGCAPIPSSGPAIPASVPTGKWDTRWGAIAQDSDPLPGGSMPVGVAESEKSKREATSTSLAQCQRAGGRRCKVLLDYHNQCAALVGTVYNPSRRGITYTFSAPTIEQARSKALEGCEVRSSGSGCTVIYSACSMSEFKSFK